MTLLEEAASTAKTMHSAEQIVKPREAEVRRVHFAERDRRGR
jgi:hypothetical protein